MIGIHPVKRRNPRIIDMTGARYGRLLVVDYANRSTGGKAFWLCKCDCGKSVEVSGDQLRRGKTRSCGCLMKKHGMRDTRIYKRWVGMKKRCYNPNAIDYHNYGGRGIKVCDDWLNDFTVFYKWAMKNGYSDELEIDRIDNNGSYEPSNCRFVKPKTNARNRRTNRLVQIDGEIKTISEWADISGVNKRTLIDRVNRGWPPSKLLWKGDGRRGKRTC